MRAGETQVGETGRKPRWAKRQHVYAGRLPVFLHLKRMDILCEK